MNSFDTITLAISKDYVDIVNPSYFHTTTNSDGVIVGKKSLKLNYTGLNVIKIEKNVCRITISAKILGANYVQGININTIDMVFEMINKSNIIKLKTFELAHYQIHYCDVVINYRINDGENLEDYFYSLSMINN
ncbi:MAG: hypothetical protein RL017_904, partial [Pseudomonadota bacterium]